MGKYVPHLRRNVTGQVGDDETGTDCEVLQAYVSWRLLQEQAFQRMRQESLYHSHVLFLTILGPLPLCPFFTNMSPYPLSRPAKPSSLP
jgi:hypothetical protein